MKVNWTSSKKYRPSPFAQQLITEEEEDHSAPLSNDAVDSFQSEIDQASRQAEEGALEEALRKFQTLAPQLSLAAENAEDLSDRIETMQGKVAEMSAQIYNELGQYFAAVKQAEYCVSILPSWAVGFQTLGRAQFNLGDFIYAEQSFERALSLDSSLEEVKQYDLPVTRKLATEQSRKLEAKNSENSEDKIS